MKMNICVAVVSLFAISTVFAAESDAPTFRTVDVSGQVIQLADTSFVENGKRVTCQQYVKSVSKIANGKGYDIVIDKTCH